MYFKNSIPVDDVTRPPQTNYKRIQAATVRLSRSRPVIPPLLELQLIQLGNKVRVKWNKIVSTLSIVHFTLIALNLG